LKISWNFGAKNLDDSTAGHCCFFLKVQGTVDGRKILQGCKKPGK